MNWAMDTLTVNTQFTNNSVSKQTLAALFLSVFVLFQAAIISPPFFNPAQQRSSFKLGMQPFLIDRGAVWLTGAPTRSGINNIDSSLLNFNHFAPQPKSSRASFRLNVHAANGSWETCFLKLVFTLLRWRVQPDRKYRITYMNYMRHTNIFDAWLI